MIFHDLLFMLVESGYANPLTGNVLFLDVLNCKIKLINDLIDKG